MTIQNTLFNTLHRHAVVLVLGLGALWATAEAVSAHGPGNAQSRLEANKELVLDFYKTIFQEHKVAEAFEKYSVEDYIQHNPLAPDGARAAIDFLQPFFDQNPGYTSEIKRVVAEGDLVVLHNHVRMNEDDRGSAVVDIFRVEDGRVVEHWDVIQAVPDRALNDNTMF